jgi:hypothetical protein
VHQGLQTRGSVRTKDHVYGAYNMQDAYIFLAISQEQQRISRTCSSWEDYMLLIL